jgi:acetylornithine deacetylase/succinyl-diaminopimelate desuccinylase-like protein
VTLDIAEARSRAAQLWGAPILDALDTYGRIPALSPAFDPGWSDAGFLDAAVTLLAQWCEGRGLPGARVDVLRLPGLTATLLVDVPASDPSIPGTVLFYGHYDKQPPFDGWHEGLGPWTPVRRGDRLFARGLADDGYAVFAAVAAVESVLAGGGRHGRCLVLIEGSEESGSPDLAAYLAHVADRIGTPDLVIALDSGCATYDRLWVTTSLRGLISGTLSVRVLEQGIHSGVGGAVVPSSFRIVRLLLDRIEDPATGDLLLPEFRVEPPAGARAAAQAMIEAVDAEAASSVEPVGALPVVAGLRLLGKDDADRAVRVAWSASLAVTGADGLPPTSEAGNVLRPMTSVKLAIRVAPTCDADRGAEALALALTADPPHGAEVEFELEAAAHGWAAPKLAGWAAEALDRASRSCFGQPPGLMGEGGTIPFMGWLAERFPAAQLLATGVLGPDANAHGPNEHLHLPTAERLSAAMALLLDGHATRRD